MNSNKNLNTSSKMYYNDIAILKAIAILFITWFHFKWSVPEKLSPLFIGGAIGNSIFFFCSGYLLSFKEEKYPAQWLLKKYIRIIPAVWVTLSIIIICTFYRSGSFQCFSFLEWFYPQQFWFVRAILIYFMTTYLAYVVISFMSKKKERRIIKKALLPLIILSLIIHIFYYLFYVGKDSIVMDDNNVYCWFYWYVFFLLGYYEKQYGKTAQTVKSSKFSLIECVFSVFLFFLYKKYAPHFHVLVYLQFIFIPLLLLYVVYAFKRGGQFLLLLRVPDIIKHCISTLSNITLEVYLVQLFFIKWIMPTIAFPFNLFVTLIVIFTVAYVTHLFADKISSIKSYI